MKSVLLENIEYLKRINPWRIEISKEIDLIKDILKEDLNLVIAGIAADNACFIYNRKIDTIESIYKRRDYRRREFIEDVSVPRIKIRYTPGRTLIDISDVINDIYEIIERRIKSYKKEDETITLDFEPYLNIEEELKNIKKEVLDEISVMEYPVLLSDLIRKLRKKYSPLKILYAILFLYMDEIVDFDILENEEGIAIDLIIQSLE